MRGFREVGWVAAVAGTALGCYMVNLKVASERASLEDVENRIVLAQRDIRVLQTEIGTRGRLEQLESWNVKVLALSAPQAHQFMEGGFQLATLAAPRKTIDPAAPVVLAAAPRPLPRANPNALPDDNRGNGASARDLLHIASLKQEYPAAQPEKPVDKQAAVRAKAVKPPAKTAKAAAEPQEKRKAATTVVLKRTEPAPPAANKPALPTAAKTRDAKAKQ